MTRVAFARLLGVTQYERLDSTKNLGSEPFIVGVQNILDFTSTAHGAKDRI
jgi:hypothetical protein